MPSLEHKAVSSSLEKILFNIVLSLIGKPVHNSNEVTLFMVRIIKTETMPILYFWFKIVMERTAPLRISIAHT